jgi:hypothetical protein
LLLVAELDPIADAGAGDPGICNGPEAIVNIFDLDRALVSDYQRFARSFTQIRAADIRKSAFAGHGPAVLIAPGPARRPRPERQDFDRRLPQVYRQLCSK